MFLSAIFCLTLFSGASAAYVCDNPFDMNITSPEEGATTNSSIILFARTTPGDKGVDCQYTLDDSPVSYAMFRTTNGYIHNATISDLSNGQHTIYVDCIRELTYCTYTANATVTWDVYSSASIPEFPSAIIPTLLSIASFGLIKKL